MLQEHRERHVVVIAATRQLSEQRRSAAQRVQGEGDRDQPRGDDQEREEHLGHGRDQGGVARRGHVLGGHGPLHHQEVRAPVAEREHEA
ncbi:hypothetical protein D3C87_1861600 [compost metagenome]